VHDLPRVAANLDLQLDGKSTALDIQSAIGYWVPILGVAKSPVAAGERAVVFFPRGTALFWLALVPARAKFDGNGSCCSRWVDALFDWLVADTKDIYFLPRCPFLSRVRARISPFRFAGVRSGFLYHWRNYVVYSAVSGSAGAFFFACSI